MKKQLIALLAGMTVSMGAMAAADSGTLNSGASTPIGTATSGETNTCSLLGDSVTVNLSANVEGAFECDFANSAIRIATCHIGGSRAEQTDTCADVSADPNDGNVEWNIPGCTTVGEDITYTDRTAFVANSAGGGVKAQALGGNTCTGGNLQGLF